MQITGNNNMVVNGQGNAVNNSIKQDENIVTINGITLIVKENGKVYISGDVSQIYLNGKEIR